MLEYIIRCFGWSIFMYSVVAVWNNQPVYGIYLVLIALVLLNIEFEDNEK